MAISINGYITYGNDNSSWVSEIDWKEFITLKRDSGFIVMGSHTYYQFADDFPQEEALNVVMTHDPSLLINSIENVLFTDKTPGEVVQMAKDKGCNQIMLIGGMSLNTSFLKENLINEIWLDVHPLLIGKGKTVFDQVDLLKKITLLETKELGGGQFLTKYKIE